MLEIGGLAPEDHAVGKLTPAIGRDGLFFETFEVRASDDRRRRVGRRRIFCGEKGLEVLRFALEADDAVLVDQQRDRHHLDAQEIQRVDHHRPLHLLPLHEQPSPRRMLFLDDPYHLDVARLLKLPGLFVPPGHVPPAARSPGSPDVQGQLAPPKGGDRGRLAVGERGQHQLWKTLTDAETHLGSASRCGGNHRGRSEGKAGENLRELHRDSLGASVS